MDDMYAHMQYFPLSMNVDGQVELEFDWKQNGLKYNLMQIHDDSTIMLFTPPIRI